MLDETKIGNLHVIADEEQVARLDVEMLEVVLLIHVVQRFGGIAQVLEKIIARNADQTGCLVFHGKVVKRAVGELHDDDELAAGDLDAFHRADERMADFLDALECFKFLLGASGVNIERIEIAEDFLDGFEEPAGSFAFPDFAKAAATKGLDEPVPLDGLSFRFPLTGHVQSRERTAKRRGGEIISQMPRARHSTASSVAKKILTKVRSQQGNCPIW